MEDKVIYDEIGLRRTWRPYANCSGNTDIFYPERGDDPSISKRVCAGCTVRAECLNYALVRNERFGTWGGCSERMRRQIRTARRLWLATLLESGSITDTDLLELDEEVDEDDCP